FLWQPAPAATTSAASPRQRMKGRMCVLRLEGGAPYRIAGTSSKRFFPGGTRTWRHVLAAPPGLDPDRSAAGPKRLIRGRALPAPWGLARARAGGTRVAPGRP